MFSDLLFGALTGREPALGWGKERPCSPLPLGAALGWARGRVGELSEEDVRPLVGDIYTQATRLRDISGHDQGEVPRDPRSPVWREPWCVG